MFDAFRFLKEHNIPYFTTGNNVSPGWINIRCPLCADRSNHGGFNPSSEYYNCWKCGRHDLEWVISRLLGIRKGAAAELVDQYTGYNSLRKAIQRKKAGAVKIELPGGDLSRFHKQYLKRRRFNPEQLKELYQIRGTGPGECWDGLDFGLRVIIPIIYRQIIVSFQARDITDKQDLKYKGCPIEKSVIPYKDILYNLDRCQGDIIIVVEGIMDVWRLGDGFAASFGTTLTRAQLLLLSRFNKVIFLFDPERDAEKQAIKYGRELSALGCHAEAIWIDCGGDPADLDDDDAKRLKEELL